MQPSLDVWRSNPTANTAPRCQRGPRWSERHASVFPLSYRTGHGCMDLLLVEPHPGRAARRRAGSAGEGLGAEAAPRHESGHGEIDQVAHDRYLLATAEARDHRADNSNTAPTAASGTRTGAMSSAAGRIRPTAARSSRTSAPSSACWTPKPRRSPTVAAWSAPNCARSKAASRSRACVDLAGRASNLTILERTVNGQPGLVAQQDGATVAVLAFDVAGGRIKHIWAVRNPEKLRPWTTG
jgi:hypothetical protein